MAFNEQTAIDKIAAQERSIVGIRNSFDYAKNPDTLSVVQVPAVLHYIPEFTSQLRANYNVWTNTITFNSVLCVAPRQQAGGKLKFLENEAIPYGQKWRDKFQTSTVIQDLLSDLGAVKVFLTRGQYGAGGPLLTVSDVEYLGWVFFWEITNA